MLNRIKGVWLFALMALITHSALASESFEHSILQGQVEHADLTHLRQYRNFQFDLMYWVANLDKNAQTNNFCLVGYRWPDKSIEAVVSWKEESSLKIWSGRHTPPDEYGDGASDLMMTKGIDLEHNVVDREDQMGMSTYLRRDVEGTLKDCARHGIQYELKPFTPPPEKSEDDW